MLEGPSRAWRVLQGVLRYANELALYRRVLQPKKVLQTLEGSSHAKGGASRVIQANELPSLPCTF